MFRDRRWPGENELIRDSMRHTQTTTNIDLFVTNLVCITLVPEWNVKGSPTPISVENYVPDTGAVVKLPIDVDVKMCFDILGVRIKDQCFQKKSLHLA